MNKLSIFGFVLMGSTIIVGCTSDDDVAVKSWDIGDPTET